jgi:hypothetical protein
VQEARASRHPADALHLNYENTKDSTAERKNRIVELTTLWTLLKLVAALSPLNSRAAGAAHATAEESAIVAMSKE